MKTHSHITAYIDIEMLKLKSAAADRDKYEPVLTFNGATGMPQ